MKSAIDKTLHLLPYLGSSIEKIANVYVISHQERTSDYAAAIASSLGLGSEYVEHIRKAGVSHDIGKYGIPLEILLKKGNLTPQEFSIMKNHTFKGGQYLINHHDKMASGIALFHHENYDGTGYFGLRGEQIPLSARLFKLADVYDSLTSKRPYREPLSHNEAVSVILNGDGRTSPKQFDPEILSVFEKMHPLIREINAYN